MNIKVYQHYFSGRNGCLCAKQFAALIVLLKQVKLRFTICNLFFKIDCVKIGLEFENVNLAIMGLAD